MAQRFHHRFGQGVWCPWCSTATLVRDTTLPPERTDRAEYFCTLCGIGFAVMPSTRYVQACQYFNDERRGQHNGTRRADRMTDAAGVAAFNRHLEENGGRLSVPLGEAARFL